MLRVVAIVVLGLMLLAPTAAYAHDEEWSPGPMKSDGASPGITCTAVGSYQGHTYTWRYAMVGDAGMPIASERAWLQGFCDRAGREDVKGWFRYQEGLEIPDSAIRVTFAHGG